MKMVAIILQRQSGFEDAENVEVQVTHAGPARTISTFNTHNLISPSTTTITTTITHAYNMNKQ